MASVDKVVSFFDHAGASDSTAFRWPCRHLVTIEQCVASPSGHDEFGITSGGTLIPVGLFVTGWLECPNNWVKGLWIYSKMCLPTGKWRFFSRLCLPE